MDKITYSIIEKNKKVVKIPKLYGRIRAGKRERLVPLGRNMEEAQKWLKRAQRAYEEACDLETEGKPIPYDLWSSLEVRRGNPEDRMFPLVSPSQSRRYRVLRRALGELGLEGGLHTFRHSVSMLLFKKCGDIKSVCQVLGHSPQVGLEYYQHTRSVEEVREKVFGE